MTTGEHEKPKQARSFETREKIVETGLRLFCEFGYHATSSKKIAKAAEVATGTFYNHFKDKKALLLEIHRRHSDAVHQEIERFFKSHPISKAGAEDSLAMMSQMVELIYKTHSLSPKLHREIGILSHIDPDFARMNRTEKERAHEKLNELLAPFLEKMRIRDPEAAHILVSQTMEAIIHGVIISEPTIGKQRILDALADMLNRYLFE